MAHVLGDVLVIDLPAQAIAMTSRSHRCLTATRIEKDNLFWITGAGPLVLLYEFTMILSIPFARQTRPQAVKHYEEKIEYIKTNLDALQETMQKKQDNMSYLVNVIQSKLQSRAPQDSEKP
jgi:hypothetical protein